MNSTTRRTVLSGMVAAIATPAVGSQNASQIVELIAEERRIYNEYKRLSDHSSALYDQWRKRKEQNGLLNDSDLEREYEEAEERDCEAIVPVCGAQREILRYPARTQFETQAKIDWMSERVNTGWEFGDRDMAALMSSFIEPNPQVAA